MICEVGDVDREVGGDVGRELAKLFLVRGNRPGRDQIFMRGE